MPEDWPLYEWMKHYPFVTTPIQRVFHHNSEFARVLQQKESQRHSFRNDPPLILAAPIPDTLPTLSSDIQHSPANALTFGYGHTSELPRSATYLARDEYPAPSTRTAFDRWLHFCDDDDVDWIYCKRWLERHRLLHSNFPPKSEEAEDTQDLQLYPLKAR